MIQNKNMFVYHTKLKGHRSFKMLPVTEDCPFNEAIYDPAQKILTVISKEYKQKPQIVHKLEPSPLSHSTSQPVEERIIMGTYYEYYLDFEEDIISFVNMFAANPTHDSLDMIFPDTETETLIIE